MVKEIKNSECPWYNGTFEQYELMGFDPNGLTKEDVINRAKIELNRKYSFGEEELDRAMKTVYLVNVDDLKKVI